jgi:hypothetical protein
MNQPGPKCHSTEEAKAQVALMPTNPVAHTSREIHAYGHRGASAAIRHEIERLATMALALSESQPVAISVKATAKL